MSINPITVSQNYGILKRGDQWASVMRMDGRYWVILEVCATKELALADARRMARGEAADKAFVSKYGV